MASIIALKKIVVTLLTKHLFLQTMQLNMIRNYFLLFTISGILFSACNNNSPNTETVAAPTEEKQLRDAIAQYPDSLLLTENLIQYFRDNSNFGQAIAETEKAIQKDTGNARLWDIKATLLFQNADTINAIKAFEKAISVDPQPSYKISLGLIYAQIKNAKALELADALLKDPEAKAGKQASFIKGFYYSYKGDYQNAISYFDTCLALDYTYIDAYKEKAICLYNITKYKEAIQSLEKALALQSTFDEAYYWMGRCYEKLGDRKEAITNYQNAIQIDPEYTEAKDALAKLGGN